MAINYSIYSKLFLDPTTQNTYSSIPPSSHNKILFFGVILGYRHSDIYRLDSTSKDTSIWTRLCKKNNIQYKITTDERILVDEEYLAQKIQKIIHYGFNNLSDLIIILISGHGEKNDRDDDFFFIMYDERGELLKVNLSLVLMRVLLEEREQIKRANLNILFLFDTCYSKNPLYLNYELMNPTPKLFQSSFYDYMYKNDLKELNIWSIGASKGLTSINYTNGTFVSEFTEKIFKLNTYNEDSLLESLNKIKSIYSDINVFFSKIKKKII